MQGEDCLGDIYLMPVWGKLGVKDFWIADKSEPKQMLRPGQKGKNLGEKEGTPWDLGLITREKEFKIIIIPFLRKGTFNAFS